MFSLTPSITLSQKQRSQYRMLQIALLATLCVGIYLLIASIILPKVTLSHNVRNTDPLLDLTPPQSSGDTITFSGSLAQDVDRLTITMKFPDEQMQSATTVAPTVAPTVTPIVSVSKGYKSFLQSAISDQPYFQSSAQDEMPFLSGDIIRSSTEYFVVNGITLQPVASSEAFLAAGYDFGTAIDATSEQRSLYEKADRFDMHAAHPPGTYYRDVSTDQYYRLGDATLHKAEKPLSNTTPVILASELSRQNTSTCKLQKSRFSSTYKCTINLQNTSLLPGKDYIFNLQGISQEPQSIQTTFSVTPTTKNIQSRLGLIKQKLNQ